MSTRERLLVAVLVACSAWAAWLSFAVLEGKLPASWARRSLPTGKTAVPGSDCDCGPTSGRAPEAAAATSGSASAARKLERYTVCGREEGPPALAELPGLAQGDFRIAVHCGSRVHLIALDEGEGGGADGLRPRRVAALEGSSPSPAEALRAVVPVTADLDGDGRADLLVPQLLVDGQGIARGGALQLLRGRPEGGFERAQRALELAPSAVAPMKVSPGHDGLALVQLGAPALQRSNELWTVHGGPAPLRTHTRTSVGIGTAALAVADLDRDGLDDIAVSSETDQRVRLFRRAGQGEGEPLQWDVPGLHEMLSTDLDGDGALDLVLVGTKLWFVLASKTELVPRVLPESSALRDVHAVDVDRDGKLDLVGYAHPSIIAELQRADLSFERRTVLSIVGDAAIYSARLLQRSAQRPPNAWITSFAGGSEPTIEVSFAREVTIGSTLELAASARALPDAPLVERFALR